MHTLDHPSASLFVHTNAVSFQTFQLTGYGLNCLASLKIKAPRRLIFNGTSSQLLPAAIFLFSRAISYSVLPKAFERRIRQDSAPDVLRRRERLEMLPLILPSPESIILSRSKTILRRTWQTMRSQWH